MGCMGSCSRKGLFFVVRGVKKMRIVVSEVTSYSIVARQKHTVGRCRRRELIVGMFNLFPEMSGRNPKLLEVATLCLTKYFFACSICRQQIRFGKKNYLLAIATTCYAMLLFTCVHCNPFTWNKCSIGTGMTRYGQESLPARIRRHALPSAYV